MYGLIIDPHNDQLPVGLIAQLVECCTGIAEVRVQVPFMSTVYGLIINPHNDQWPVSRKS